MKKAFVLLIASLLLTISLVGCDIEFGGPEGTPTPGAPAAPGAITTPRAYPGPAVAATPVPSATAAAAPYPRSTP